MDDRRGASEAELWSTTSSAAPGAAGGIAVQASTLTSGSNSTAAVFPSEPDLVSFPLSTEAAVSALSADGETGVPAKGGGMQEVQQQQHAQRRAAAVAAVAAETAAAALAGASEGEARSGISSERVMMQSQVCGVGLTAESGAARGTEDKSARPMVVQISSDIDDAEASSATCCGETREWYLDLSSSSGSVGQALPSPGAAGTRADEEASGSGSAYRGRPSGEEERELDINAAAFSGGATGAPQNSKDGPFFADGSSAAAAPAAVETTTLEREELTTNVSGKNVFVFQIPTHWKEQDLRQCFASFGTIVSVRVEKKGGEKNRGYGFVCFASSVSAQLAVLHMNGQTIEGKTLKVSIKRPRAKQDEGAQSSLRKSSSNTSKVGAFGASDPGVPVAGGGGTSGGPGAARLHGGANNKTKIALQQQQQQYPRRTPDCGHSRQMLTASATAAVPLAPQSRNGRQHPRSRTAAQQQQPQQHFSFSSHTVCVFSVPLNWTEDDLRKHFEMCGRCRSVGIARRKNGSSKGFGYVDFEEADAALAALQQDGVSAICSDGKSVRLKITLRPAAQMEELFYGSSSSCTNEAVRHPRKPRSPPNAAAVGGSRAAGGTCQQSHGEYGDEDTPNAANGEKRSEVKKKHVLRHHQQQPEQQQESLQRTGPRAAGSVEEVDEKQVRKQNIEWELEQEAVSGGNTARSAGSWSSGWEEGAPGGELEEGSSSDGSATAGAAVTYGERRGRRQAVEKGSALASAAKSFSRADRTDASAGGPGSAAAAVRGGELSVGGTAVEGEQRISQECTSQQQHLAEQQAGEASQQGRENRRRRNAQQQHNRSSGGAATGRQQSYEGDQSGSNNTNKQKCTVFVFHVPPDWDDADLKRHFRHFGRIRAATIQRNKTHGESRGFAFVSFETPSAARNAVLGMHGFHTGSKYLKVMLKTSSNSSNGKSRSSAANVAIVPASAAPAQKRQPQHSRSMRAAPAAGTAQTLVETGREAPGSSSSGAAAAGLEGRHMIPWGGLEKQQQLPALAVGCSSGGTLPEAARPPQAEDCSSENVVRLSPEPGLEKQREGSAAPVPAAPYTSMQQCYHLHLQQQQQTLMHHPSHSAITEGGAAATHFSATSQLKDSLGGPKNRCEAHLLQYSQQQQHQPQPHHLQQQTGDTMQQLKNHEGYDTGCVPTAPADMGIVSGCVTAAFCAPSDIAAPQHDSSPTPHSAVPLYQDRTAATPTSIESWTGQPTCSRVMPVSEEWPPTAKVVNGEAYAGAAVESAREEARAVAAAHYPFQQQPLQPAQLHQLQQQQLQLQQQQIELQQQQHRLQQHQQQHLQLQPQQQHLQLQPQLQHQTLLPGYPSYTTTDEQQQQQQIPRRPRRRGGEFS